MAIKVKVSGVNLVLSGLNKYSEDAQKLVSYEVMAWAERTESAAKRDVPVDTSALKNSIRWVVGANKMSVSVRAGGINGVNYAPFVNWGTGSFVDEAWLQEFGLVAYAAQFKGKGERLVNLPMREFLYGNARTEFEKTFQNIKRLLQADARAMELRK